MIRQINTPPGTHPYVAVDPNPRDRGDLCADRSIRRLLRDRAIDTAVSLARRITQRGQAGVPAASLLPPLLESVDRATDGLASRRIANMLDAFVEFVRNPKFFGSSTGDAGETRALFIPLAVPPPSEQSGRPKEQSVLFLTSPALLVIQAILFGHAAWFRPRHHEAHSAFLAYSVLGGKEYDPPLYERDRRFVAGLIAHQTLLRVAWQLDPKEHPREVCAYNDKCLTENFELEGAESDNQTAELLAQAIGSTLFEFLRNPENGQEYDLREELSEALVLLSLCLQCRHLRHPEGGLPDERLLDRRKQILRFCKLLPKPTPLNPPSLVFFQFGRRVMRAQKAQGEEGRNAWNDFRGKVVEKFEKVPRPTNMTVCFDRIAGRIGELQDEKRFTTGFSGESTPESKTVQEIEKTVGWTVDVDSSAGRLNRQFPAATSSESGKAKQSPEPDELDKLIRDWDKNRSVFFELYRALEGRVDSGSDGASTDEEYYPAPLVGRLLSLLSQVRPERFSTLRLRPRNVPQAVLDEPLLRRPLTVPLPRIGEDDLPTEDRNDSKPSDGKDPNLNAGQDPGQSDREICDLIARYVAAMVMNVVVSLGPQRIDLDYFSDDGREFWSKRVDSALEENDHKSFLDYLDMVHAKRCGVAATDTIRSTPLSSTLPNDYDLPGESVLGIDVGGTRVKCARYRVKRRNGGDGYEVEVGAMIGKETVIPTEPPTGCYRDANFFARYVADHLPDKWFENLLAVGVTWPGAVHGDGTIAGPSMTITKFACFEGWPRERVNPHELHQLEILDAFKKELRTRVGDKPLVVVLLNDGDADVRSDEQLADEKSRAEVVSLVLKAGTGTACGLYVGPRQVPLLAEAGKMVLDLGRRGWPKGRRGYPRGLLNPHCSAKTLPRLAEALGWKIEDLQSHEVGFFLEDADSEPYRRLREEIGEKRIEDLCKALPRDQAGRAAAEVARAFASRCARIAGDHLGDAIAMLVSVFRCSEVRLGGGALSGATGELVTEKARERLQRIYGFGVTDRRPSGEAVRDAHALTEIRKIGVILHASAKEDRGPAGAHGAARAALDRAVRWEKAEALRRVRAELHDPRFGKAKSSSAANEIDLHALARQNPPLIEDEVRAMVEAYMATLGVTRAPSGAYYKFHPRRGPTASTGEATSPDASRPTTEPPAGPRRAT